MRPPMAWIYKVRYCVTKPAIWIPIGVLGFLILSVLSLWVVARAHTLGLLACCPLPVTLQGESGTGLPGVRPGQPAPNFRLVDGFGCPVTRQSLTGNQPGLVFFTATWCVPCVEGLRELVRFQQEASTRLGVLLVFVDPSEAEADLRTFQQRYGFPKHWYYALDRQQLFLQYRVRTLDSKFLLDQAGVIRYADTQPATYAAWAQALASLRLQVR